MRRELLYITRHARNKMRWFKVSLEGIKECVDYPMARTSGTASKLNYWIRSGELFLRVTVAEEADRLVVVTVTVRRKGPREGQP